MTAMNKEASCMLRAIWSVPLIMLLTACAGTPGKATPRQYDLAVGVESKPPSALPFTQVDVQGGVSVNNAAMLYRYADTGQRGAFTASRWSMPPAEQLEVLLGRVLGTQSRPVCVLRLEIDDFVQIFPSMQPTPTSSFLRLDARALIQGRDAVVARQTLRLEVPAGADAESGVRASAVLLQQMTQSLLSWGNQHCPR